MFAASGKPQTPSGFSALQRAEIAEIDRRLLRRAAPARFSALQRAEIAEIKDRQSPTPPALRVSVLFNEPKLLKCVGSGSFRVSNVVSVLFNEPKLLKSSARTGVRSTPQVSVLFNEPKLLKYHAVSRSRTRVKRFQCSSTSRNC